MAEAGSESEGEHMVTEIFEEGVENELQVESGDRNVREEGCDARFEQMINLIKEINRKVNCEVRSIRKEIKGKFSEIEERRKDDSRRWEQELKEIKEKLESDKMQITTQLRQGLASLEQKYESIGSDRGKKGENREEDDWIDKCRDNERHISSFWQELDEERARWRDAMEELREETNNQLIAAGKDMEIKVQQEIKRVEEVVVRRDVMKRQEKEVDMISNREIEGRMRGREDVDNSRQESQEIIELGVSKDIIPPKFDDRPDENPKSFVEEFEEFARLKRIPKYLKKTWFRRCVGEKVGIWYEAIGRTAENFRSLKETFLKRYWSNDRQMNIVRKFYMPGSYKDKSIYMEQHLLKAVNENRFLDNPLTERNLVLAVSRHFGDVMAKQVVTANVSSVEEFAGILNAWEIIDQGKESRDRQITVEPRNVSFKHVENNNWRNNRNWKDQGGWKRDQRIFECNEDMNRKDLSRQGNGTPEKGDGVTEPMRREYPERNFREKQNSKDLNRTGT